MPVFNLDAVAPQRLDVTKGEQAWKLRMDVPSSRLVRCFYLLELEQARPTLDLDPAAGPVDMDAVRALEEELRAYELREELETLAVLGDLWRWSYPEVTDEQLGEWLAPMERRQLVQVFFLALLARSGKLPRAVTGASSPTDSPAHATTSERTPQLETLETTENSPSSRAPDSTPSATRSPAASSSSPQPRRRQRQTPRTAARTDPRTAARSTS